jgi:integrase/recombinase XerD
MKKAIDEYIQYLKDEKNVSLNTELSYRSDLEKMRKYFESQGVANVTELDAAALNSYVLYQEKTGRTAATISRSVASMRGYFDYLYKRQVIQNDITEKLHAPRIERKAPEILSKDEIQKLLHAPQGNSIKVLRDRAMLYLLYATGIHVSEMIVLSVDDVNLDTGCIVCRDEERKRVIPVNDEAKDILTEYLKEARPRIIRDDDVREVFVNMNGGSISRQGFWKIIKSYAEIAGIERSITPNMIRHSFAAHLVEIGTSMEELKTLMGHRDWSSTQQYYSLWENRVKETIDRT